MKRMTKQEFESYPPKGNLDPADSTIKPQFYRSKDEKGNPILVWLPWRWMEPDKNRNGVFVSRPPLQVEIIDLKQPNIKLKF